MDTDDEVRLFVESVTPERRRSDAETLLGLMERATGETARLERNVVAYGQYHYRYGSGREGDAAAAAFAPRKAATTVYLMDGVGAHASELERLGPHTTGVGCLYIKDFAAIDLEVLEEIVASSYRTLTSGTLRDGSSLASSGTAFGQRAREGRES